MLLQENNIFYSFQEENGFSPFSYHVSYFDDRDNKVISLGEKKIYTRNKQCLFELVNYWNSKNSNYKYWI